MVMAMSPDLHAAGVDWWNQRFGDVHDDTISFSTAFLPALLKSSRLELPANEMLSVDEVRVLAKYIVADSAWQHDIISLTGFLRFLARFGSVESSLQRMVESLTTRRELVTWFHGSLTRAETEQVLLTPSSSAPLEDGTFLIRFSESHPTRFCLSYLKIHTTGPRVGKREMRNVLIEYNGVSGFVLIDTPNKSYPSLRNFIARSSSKLKNGITSPFARKCNLELASVRVRQDMASNSYTSFSTDSLGASSSTTSSPVMRPQQLPASLLFSKTPELSPLPAPGSRGTTAFSGRGNNQEDHAPTSDDYAEFSQLPPPLTFKTPSFNTTSRGSNNDGEYGAFSATTMSSSPPRANNAAITPPSSAEYGDFSTFSATTFSASQRTSSPGRSPTVPSTSEYASFASFSLTTTTASSSSASDTYGSFSPFDVASSSTTTTTTTRSQAASFHNLQGDDYGSFASLTLESSTVGGAVQSEDTYGSFSFSTTDYDPPPPPQRPLSSTHSIPPSSMPVDTYGSFESLLSLQESTVTTSPPQPSEPRSAPAALPATADDDAESKASALDELNAGMEFYKLKQLDHALLRFIHARELAQTAQDQVVEARALGNLGTVYLDKLNPQQAVQCYEQCLHITRSIRDVKRERTILNNLVLALMAAENYDSAYRYCEIQLEITLNEINRRKILTRMSELREKAARAMRSASARALTSA